jgi:hypothetical protein
VREILPSLSLSEELYCVSFGIDWKTREERILLESYMCFQWGLTEEAYELMADLVAEVVDNGESFSKTKEVVETIKKFYSHTNRKK